MKLLVEINLPYQNSVFLLKDIVGFKFFLSFFGENMAFVLSSLSQNGYQFLLRNL